MLSEKKIESNNKASFIFLSETHAIQGHIHTKVNTFEAMPSNDGKSKNEK